MRSTMLWLWYMSRLGRLTSAQSMGKDNGIGPFNTDFSPWLGNEIFLEGGFKRIETKLYIFTVEYSRRDIEYSRGIDSIDLMTIFQISRRFYGYHFSTYRLSQKKVHTTDKIELVSYCLLWVCYLSHIVV